MKKEKKLNKFEEARLFSARAIEISDGDKPKIKVTKKKATLNQDYIKIAKEEYETGKLELEIYKD